MSRIDQEGLKQQKIQAKTQQRLNELNDLIDFLKRAIEEVEDSEQKLRKTLEDFKGFLKKK